MKNYTNEENYKNQTGYSLKTHIIIPTNFISTLAVAICFISIKGFTNDLSPVVVWFYFAVSILATAAAIIDIKINKEKSSKSKQFVAVMCGLNIIATILYVVFYLIVK